MEFGLEFYLVAALVVFLTGVSKSGFGAGLEMLAVPVMALFIVPQVAAGIMLPILIAIDAANIWRYRKDWDRRMVFAMGTAALVGISVGAMTFHLVSSDWMKLGLGILALVFVLQRLLLSPKGGGERKPGNLLTGIMGALSGFTSFVSHAGGPPSKIILLSQGYSNRRFVGTNSYLFALINLLKCVPYYFLGQLSVSNIQTSISLAPFVVLGIICGFWLNGMISQTWFNRIVITALAVVGIKLIIDGSIVLSHTV